MKWYTGLYIGKKASERLESIIKDINQKKADKNVFLITLPSNNVNMLDIITADMGIIITWREVYVIGIAYKKQEALMLTADIIKSVYYETGGFNLTEYFSEFLDSIDRTCLNSEK